MTPARSWLRRHAPRPYASARVFCLPHAGGSASTYRGWAAAAPWDVEFVAVQYPGHEDLLGTGPAGSMRELAAGVAAAVEPLADVPYLLFGHSMGAVVAYEAARRLARRSRGPHRLVVSGRPAPHRSRPGTVHLSGDDELAAHLARLGGTRDTVLDHPELRAFLLPIVRHDYRLTETYRPLPGPALTAPVTVLYGVDDPEVTREEAEAWGASTTGPCEVLAFPGGHFYIAPDGEPVTAAVVERARAGCPAGTRWPSTP
ncbi:thioesterase II family protein [Sphaerisporangium dianthi]|uniref:Thioesterase II family protein n=1 Tax=Sphaerisporangium dianthi TaxID=1436120 RepID=A0ABV9CWF2_9ACTN